MKKSSKPAKREKLRLINKNKLIYVEKNKAIQHALAQNIQSLFFQRTCLTYYFPPKLKFGRKLLRRKERFINPILPFVVTFVHVFQRIVAPLPLNVTKKRDFSKPSKIRVFRKEERVVFFTKK